jgi:hypothetical protein
MVDNASVMTAPAWKETDARSLPLLTYSVLGKKFVSLRDENNFALSCASSEQILSLCARYCCSALSPVDATVRLSRLVDEGGSDPTNFLGG